MVVRISKIIFLLAVFSAAVSGQTVREIKSKNRELSKIREEISRLEKDVSKLSLREKSAGAELENIEKQIFLVERLIEKTNRQIKKTKIRISELGSSIAGLEKEKKRINAALNQYAVWLYESRDVGLLDFLLNSKSFNEAYDKVYYFIFFNRSVKEQIKKLNEIKSELQLKKSRLTEKERTLKTLVAANKKTAVKLKKKLAEQKTLLAEIRKNKKRKAALVERKRKSAKEIAGLINSLIKKEKEIEEAKRKEKLAAAKKIKKNKTTAEKKNIYFPNVKFGVLKGKLPWPVKGGRIVKKFGKVRNKRLKTVTVNSGIDIKTGRGKVVRAVAGGVVSTIAWLPGFGSVVIVSHNKKYRTVYGRLGNIKVEEGEKVKAGEVLGDVSESVEGNILHFEIWKERKYQNPQKWLVRK